MIRIFQFGPESFIERVLRLLAEFERKHATEACLPAKLCTAVKNVEKPTETVTA